MKKLLLILSLIFSVTLFGQQEKTYYIEDLNTINDSISNRIESYVPSFSHNLYRDSKLDKRAKLRNTYFISVVQQTSKTGESFSEMVDSIPGGKIGHTQCFGKPAYFSPAEVPYPDMFPVLSEMNLKIKGEIMYQVVWSSVLNEKQISHNQLMQRAIKDIKEKYGVDRISQKVVGEYKKSKSHNEIIKERGNGRYGSSTMVIISEKKLPDGRWAYEIMIRNLIVFTEQI